MSRGPPREYPVAGVMQTSGFRHEALLYRGLQDFLAATLPFIREGLAAGEPVMVAVPPPRVAAIRDALGGEAPRVHFVDMTELGRNPACIIPAWHSFLEGRPPGGGRVRGIGEPIWVGRSPAEIGECQRHEALLNLAFDGGPAWSLVCPYDAEGLDPAVLAEAGRGHPHLRGGGASAESPAYQGPHALPDAPLAEPRGPVLEFPVRPGQLDAVRSAVGRHAAAAGLDPGACADLVVAMNELAVNAVRHGGGRGWVRMWAEAGEVVCEVRDRGRIDDPLVGRRRPAPDQLGGRGLWWVNRLCDLVQVRTSDEGSVVRVHMHRARGAGAQDAVGTATDLLGSLGRRLTAGLDRRLSQSDRSLLWTLSRGGRRLLAEIPVAGVSPSRLRQLDAEVAGAGSSGASELRRARLLRSVVAGGDEWIGLTGRALDLRGAIDRARREVIAETLGELGPARATVVLEALEALAS